MLIPDVLKGLNDEQLAVATCETNCMVIAGPGSGKTNTVARKAALALADPARRVGAVTFTKEAALELRERIVRHAGMDVAPRLLVGTFHSTMLLMAFPQKKVQFGSEILRAGRSGFGANPWNVVKEGYRRSYILRAMNEVGLEGDLEEMSRIIEQIKGGRQPQELRHEQLVRAYTEIMSRNQVIDFQDILLRTNEGLQDGHVTPLNVTDLIIDEYQDTDDTQFEWAAAHHKAAITLTAVGDDDQSIYGFRRALGFEGMERFAKSFDAQKLILNRNYRSHSEILEAAGNVIVQNIGRLDKTLIAEKGPGGETRWLAFPDREAEAFGAASYGASAIASGKSVAILARNNRRLDLLEACLTGRGIPYSRPPGESILNRPEVATFGAALRFILNPSVRGLDTLLAWAGIDESDIRAIHRAFGESLVLGSADDFKRHGVSDEAKTKWRNFVRIHEGWKHTYTARLENLVIHAVYEWLESCTSDSRVTNQLRVAKEVYQPRPADPATQRPAQTIKQRLEALERSEKDRKEKAQTPTSSVALMTAHGSKGLEFDHVWILGVEEESFPAKDAGLEEERRLMFVAMTRARKDLTISTGGGKPPSPFVAESKLKRMASDAPAAA